MKKVLAKSAPSIPSQKALYDQFLDSLPKEDKKASKGSGESSDGSVSQHSKESTRSDGVSTDGDESSNAGAEKSFTEEEIEKFLRKIYEPVDKVYGFDYDKMSLKMLLLDDKNDDVSIKLLGVVGMVGVGKTALSRSILDEEEVKQRFVPRIQIAQSEEPRSMEGVVRRMLKHLGVEKEIVDSISNAHKLPGLLYALHLQLKGKRYLILLDDVRKEDEYYETLKSCLKNGHGFPKGQGGVVIVTSRDEEAVTKMVEKQNLHLHRLVPISDSESCWPIYQNLALADFKTLNTSSSSDSTPKEVKEELKKKCGGLPLAARIMGELKRQELGEGSKDVDSPETGDGSKEASETSKGGPTIQASQESGDIGPKETLMTLPKDGHEKIISEDGPKQEESSRDSKDVVSSDGPEEESAVPKDGSSQASKASTKPDLQPEANQNQA